jgi:hypothetical protein
VDETEPTRLAEDAIAGVAQLVELQPSKLVVVGSSPIARSETLTETRFCPRSTVVVHFLGKEGVASSILAEGSAAKADVTVNP